MDKEDGEMSDENSLACDEDVDMEEPNKPIPAADVDCTVLYKADKSGLIVEKLERVDAVKLEERAKRFGLNLTGTRVVTQKQIDDLYANFGINGNERHFRFDTLHLSGIDGLSTADIFEYLEDYKPVSLEWIDDMSCNVVCQDNISAALALLVHSREIKDEYLKEMLAKKTTQQWREGVPHPKKDLIVMRFATNADKKMSKKKPEIRPSENQSMDSISKNPWGDLCKSWGVYDHQEVFTRKLIYDDNEEPMRPLQIKNKKLAMRLGKRTHKVEESEDSSSDSEWKKRSKAPRMRMHADDEESKLKKKQFPEQVKVADKDEYAPLSIEVVNSRSHYTPKETSKLSDKFKYHNVKSNASNQRERIQSRLGAKMIPTEESYSTDDDDDYASDNSDHNVMSRVQKVSSRAKSGSSVWSRLDTKPTKPSSQSDLRQVLKSKKEEVGKSDDLRGRLSKLKRSNLRIEIDNN